MAPYLRANSNFNHISFGMLALIITDVQTHELVKQGIKAAWKSKIARHQVSMLRSMNISVLKQAR